MAIPNYKTEGGNGGKRGHSNMDHWMTTEEIKDITRKRRRLEEEAAITEQLNTHRSPADIVSKMLDTLRPDLARSTPPITDYYLIPALDDAPSGLSITLICDHKRDLPALKRQLPTWTKILCTHLIAHGFDPDDASTCYFSATSRDHIALDGGAFNHFR
jgi:hypothetical protein